MKTIFLLLMTTAALMAHPVMAQEKPASAKAEDVILEGTLVCLGCDLKEMDGARANCDIFGHRHALKTADNRYVSFLENKYSKDLIKGCRYHNQAIQVSGKYYAGASLMDVESFTFEGKKMGWCDHCQAMDHCPFVKDKKK